MLLFVRSIVLKHAIALRMIEALMTSIGEDDRVRLEIFVEDLVCESALNGG